MLNFRPPPPRPLCETFGRLGAWVGLGSGWLLADLEGNWGSQIWGLAWGLEGNWGVHLLGVL